MPRATSTSVSVMITGTASTGSWCSTCPVTGSSQVVKPPPSWSTKPRATDPTARMIIGQSMSAGDSCGVTSRPSLTGQRRRPANVMKNRRDM